MVVSEPTNKRILELGVQYAVGEACLPVKIFYGHVAELRGKVDYIFVPRLVSVEPKAYICPKLMGLPDMLKVNIPDLPPIISVTSNHNQGAAFLKAAVQEAGRILTRNRRRIEEAWMKAYQDYRAFRELVKEGLLPERAVDRLEGKGGATEGGGRLKVAIIGHAYNIYDHFASMNLIGKIERLGGRVVTADMLPREIVETEAARLPKKLFWTLGRRILGAAFYFLRQDDIKGIIQVTSFGCGPDSLVGDLVERYVFRARGCPLLSLTLDEHTGQAGIDTRLEAFMDMVTWREESARDISSHG